MIYIDRFRVVYAVTLYNGRVAVEAYSPGLDSGGSLSVAHRIVGVTTARTYEAESVALMLGGYMRGLGSTDMTGWEPDVGDALWCGNSGKPTTTRPTSGAQVHVGTYLGSGIVLVEVKILPGLIDLSFLDNSVTLQQDSAPLWDTASGAFVPQRAQPRDEKGQENGYASLDSSAQVRDVELGDGAAGATVFLRGDRTWTNRIAAVRVDALQQDDGLQLVGAQIQGWEAPTGTPTRTTFATGSVALSDLAERVKALIDDLMTHGLIGEDLIVPETIGTTLVLYPPTVS